MERSYQTEILDGESVSGHLVERAYRELTRIHRYLGNIQLVAEAVRRDPLPVRRILDVGCAEGGVLRELQARLGVDVVGVDLRAPVTSNGAVQIVRADAVRDPLPRADLAISLYLGHHLSESDLTALIANVGRFCRRFILLDVVRHPMPLALFSLFIAPVVSPIVASDGRLSFRRAYTGAEMKAIAARALAGSGAHFRHSVAPFYTRQVLDISWPAASSRLGEPNSESIPLLVDGGCPGAL